MSHRLKDLLVQPPERPFLAVLGYPIGHSLSPLIHTRALKVNQLEWDYLAVSVPETDRHLLPELMQVPAFKGANVTLPLKELVPDIVDRCDDEVLRIGAANTIYSDGPKWAAANTDVHGFLHPILSEKPNYEHQAALILGTGGAARAVCYALAEKMNMAPLYLVSRNADNVDRSSYPASDRIKPVSYEELHKPLLESVITVNTTPVGMYPETKASPLPEEFITLLKDNVCYDLIYRPRETRFLQQAREAGSKVINGLPMFVHQAAKSFEIWTGKPFPVEEAQKLISDEIYA